MATYRAQVVIPMFTNLPSDVTTNTFHFTEMTPLDLPTVAASITPLLATFYQNVYGGGRSMSNYMRPSTATVNWYDLSQPQPRAPLIVPLGATIPVVASSIPTEVSAVLSFQGAPISGLPQARRRGRIFMPALTTPWLETGATDAFPKISAAAVAALAAQAIILMDGSATESARWSVWSPTNGDAVLIDNGWVDNSPDTQRRRSVDATARTLWS